MHVLILPSFYPEKCRPTTGMFFRSQAIALASLKEKVGVAYVEQKSLRNFLFRFKENLYQNSVTKDNDIVTYRTHGLSFLNQFELGARIWMYFMEKLVGNYIKVNGKPDIIHAHNILHAGRVAARIKKKWGIPFVLTEHSSSFLIGSNSTKQLKKCRKVIGEAKNVLSVSKSLADAITEQIGYCNIQIVPNVVDTDFFYPSNIKSDDKFTFICVGNVMKNKGQEILLKAFVKEFTLNDNVQLLICGDGPDLNKLKGFVSECGFQTKIFFYGSVSPFELVGLYHKSNCLVSPSIKETFGVVLIEAMACGLPVISTKSGGPEDIVNNNNGILIEAESVIDLAKAMRFIFNNEIKFKSSDIAMSIREKYSPDVVAKRILEFY